MKVLKRIILIVIILLIIFVILFGLNLKRNSDIINRIAKTYEEFNELNNFHEYSHLIFAYDKEGKALQESITESYYKDGVLKANLDTKMIGNEFIKTVYYLDRNSKEEIYCDTEGNPLSISTKVKSDGDKDVELKAVNISEKGPSFVMRIDEVGAKGLIVNNLFNYIKEQDGYYVINQNKNGDRLLVDKETNIIRYRLNSDNQKIWECKLDKDIVTDNDVVKPEVKEVVSMDTKVQD